MRRIPTPSFASVSQAGEPGPIPTTFIMAIKQRIAAFMARRWMVFSTKLESISTHPSSCGSSTEFRRALHDLVQKSIYRPETLLIIKCHRTAFDVFYGAEALMIKLRQFGITHGLRASST